MKTVSTLALTLACTLGFLAQPAPSAAPDYPVAGVRGTILAFDYDDGGMVFFNPRIGRLAVKLDDERTRIAINDRPASLRDLRVGMKAVVMGPLTPSVRTMRAQTVRVRR